MANTANPRGLEPVQPILRMRYYTKGTNAAIYPGDVVKMGTDGKVVVSTAGSVEQVGVAQAYASATATSVLVLDDPHQQYYVQDDGVGGTLAQTNVGNNADIVATAGSTTYFRSKQSLDTSGVTSATANLRILGFHPDDTIGKYVRCRVLLNEMHQTKTAGV